MSRNNSILATIAIALCVGLTAAAAWNSAMLHESVKHEWLPVAITAAESIVAVYLLSVSIRLQWSAQPSPPLTPMPVSGLLTPEQIEAAITARVVADQESAKQALFARLGKVSSN